ncbi:MAG: hypothetical protein Q9209_001010 [Squamulea sp. 1 TL-2023]
MWGRQSSKFKQFEIHINRGVENPKIDSTMSTQLSSVSMAVDMPYTISLNGGDNVGKTTQLDLLPSHYTIRKVGELQENPKSRLSDMHCQGIPQSWWWKSSNIDFVALMVGALACRYRDIPADSVATVFDGGIAMFEAVMIAVIATKSSDHNLDKARGEFEAIVQNKQLQLPPKEKLAILLKHGRNLEDSVEISVSREDNADDRYRLYQYLLQWELQRQEQRGVYQHVLRISATSSISDIQNELRKVLLQHTGHGLFLPMLHRLDALYVISGPSAFTNSRVVEAFCSHYGTTQAFRARIAYFNNLISERLGRSIDSLPVKEQVQRLFHELERFSNDHDWLNLITIESAHCHQITKWLKKWLGRKVQIICIDSFEARNRSEADLVLDSNGTLAETMDHLLQFAKTIKKQNRRISDGYVM